MTTEEKVKSARQFKRYMKQIVTIAAVAMLLIMLGLVILILININQ